MAKDPAFLFYPGDWLGGTMGMTLEEKGAYIELLMLQFNRGHMTRDMIGQTVGQVWDKIKDKFIKDDKGLYYNIRLDQEKEKRKRYSKSRHNNRIGTNQYTKKEEKESGHMTSHMEDENEILNKVINYLNTKTKNNFSCHSRNTQQLIMERLEEKHTLKDFEKVIDNKCKEWLNTDMAKWLRPETLFSVEHFDSYLQNKLDTTEILDMDTN